MRKEALKITRNDFLRCKDFFSCFRDKYQNMLPIYVHYSRIKFTASRKATNQWISLSSCSKNPSPHRKIRSLTAHCNSSTLKLCWPKPDSGERRGFGATSTVTGLCLDFSRKQTHTHTLEVKIISTCVSWWARFIDHHQVEPGASRLWRVPPPPRGGTIMRWRIALIWGSSERGVVG